MLRKLDFLLLLMCIASTMIVQLRFTGSSIAFIPENTVMGYPRVVEILSLLLIVLNILKCEWNKETQSVVFVIILFSIFALFKPFYFKYLRSAVLIPLGLLFSIMNRTYDEKTLNIILYYFYVVITVSSVFVLLSSQIDLGVQRYISYSDTGEAERLLGFGQSLPYQAAYSLMSIPLFVYVQKNKIIEYASFINMIFLMINILAIIMTGAKTAYIVLCILGFYYLRKLDRYTILKYSLPAIAIIICATYYYSDSINELFAARNDNTSLLERFDVWSISLQLILYNPIFGIQNYFEEGAAFGHVVAHSQNGYFEIIFWGGLVTFAFYFKMIYNIFNSLFNIDHRQLLSGLMIIFFIFMISEILFFSVQAYFPLVILMGLLYSCRNNVDF